ncbi:MAG: nickel pincer cofactor biosynthesis protein LarB [Deltaproteobacteria bacterium]|nr:nickel pincer cofactor biosynthesis protein LarB [Deltaproteobacteria bacterium]
MNEKDNPTQQFVLDVERSERNRFVEAIFCEGKNLEQISQIIQMMMEKGENVFGTRLEKEKAIELVKQFQGFEYHSLSRTFSLMQKPPPLLKGTLAILAAGTSDTPVAEEAHQLAKFYGVDVKCFYDVGVAGIHRLLKRLPEIEVCDVAIVVAGMEGALPTVLGGLVSMPIIACPTSVGYGLHLGGLTPLAAMLNSCAEGISVVNIDNGFGAACAALRILRK